MKELEKQLRELLEKSEWTVEERRYLLNYLENSEGNELQNIMQEHFLENTGQENEINPEISERLRSILGKIDVPVSSERSLIRRMWPRRLLAASVIILAVSSGVYFLVNNDPVKNERHIASKTIPVQPVQKDILPGHEGAILTLDDGSVIVLDTAKNGTLVQQTNLQISKKDGRVIYNPQNKHSNDVQFNIMTTPKGRQYALVLSDGSKVWLNAASSVKFPTAFIGRERRVEITGEVYFEVVKNARMPFYVTTNGMEVAVLGTHFNVNAYAEEQVTKTTLLEGSVKLINGNQFLHLEPGQQGKVAAGEKFELLNNVDTEAVIAWKDGRFLFNRTDIKTIMRQITRWYDVEVIYEGAIPERFFTGDISRNTNLSEFLKVLEESKIHFTIEGKKLIVTP